MKRLLLALSMLVSIKAHSYSVASMDEGFDWKRPTDLFIVGYGDDAGMLFIDTAITRARKQVDAFGRQRQVMLIWAKEKNENYDSNYLKRLGLNLLFSNNEEIGMDMSIGWGERLKEITSIHFVGHANAWGGFVLQKNTYFNQDAKKLAKLKKKLTNDAFIFLHGCNTGYRGAPELSAIFEVPVFGSMTSTDFQQLHADDNWYWNNKGDYPATGGWNKKNEVSFNNTQNCSSGACTRLKANNHPYRGYWGRYETGLSFHKAFCNYDLDKRSLFSRRKGIETCYAGIWNALKSWPSVATLNERSDTATFKKVMVDYLCPKIDGRTLDQTCEDILEAADRGQKSNQTFFWGAQSQCNLKNCAWGTKMVPNEEYGQVRVFLGKDAGNNTLVEEYNLYKRVFNAYAR